MIIFLDPHPELPIWIQFFLILLIFWNLYNKSGSHTMIWRTRISQGRSGRSSLKGTQDWEFFWLRFWNLYYILVSYVKILRFYRKILLFVPLLEELRFFRVVLGLRRMKKNFEAFKKFFWVFFTYEPFIWANTSFS